MPLDRFDEEEEELQRLLRPQRSSFADSALGHMQGWDSIRNSPYENMLEEQRELSLRIERSPRDPWLRIRRARLLLDFGELRNALEECEEALSLAAPESDDQREATKLKESILARKR
jgi:hypothetical protein